MIVNIPDEGFFRAEFPAGFIEQDMSSQRVKRFRLLYLPQIDPQFDNLQTAIEVRHWVKMQQQPGDSWRPHTITLLERMQGDLEDPFLILSAQRGGSPAVCRRFAYLFTGALESIGMRARVVGFAQTHWKSENAGHTVTEVWIPELHQWVLMDAMWDLLYTVNGRPASMVDVYDVIRAGRPDLVGVVRGGVGLERLDQNLLTREFRHIFLTMTNAIFDGYRVCLSCSKPISFAQLTNDYSSPYPVFDRSVFVLFGGVLQTIALLAFLSLLQKKHSRKAALSRCSGTPEREPVSALQHA